MWISGNHRDLCHATIDIRGLSISHAAAVDINAQKEIPRRSKIPPVVTPEFVIEQITRTNKGIAILTLIRTDFLTIFYINISASSANFIWLMRIHLLRASEIT